MEQHEDHIESTSESDEDGESTSESDEDGELIGSISEFNLDSEVDIEINSTCWVEKKGQFKLRLLYMIRSIHDASQVVQMVNKVYEKLLPTQLSCFRRCLLCYATTHRHTNLVTLLLADSSYSCFDVLNASVHCKLKRPLLVAITHGDLLLVKILLQFGSSVTFQGELKAEDYLWFDSVSAIEYSFTMNKPEMLKLLVSHYHDHKPTSANEVGIDIDTNVTEPVVYNEWNKTPLHILVRKVPLENGSDMQLLLPGFIQMTIDEGVNVHDLDSLGQTPLTLLMRSVEEMKAEDYLMNLDEESHEVIVEIVQILLTAGSDPNMSLNSEVVGSMDILLESNHLDMPLELWEFSYAWAVNKYFKLVAELTKLLLTHGADPSKSPTYALCMLVASYAVETRGLLTDVPEDIDPCSEIIDSCGNIFRYLLLAGADRFTDKHWEQFVCEPYYIEVFVCIAGASSQCSGSKKLTSMSLSALSANHVKKLRVKLSEYQQAMDEETAREKGADINRAIERVQQVEVPLRLQDLARRAINRAMSVRSLDGASSLNLPHLEPYILHQ